MKNYLLIFLMIFIPLQKAFSESATSQRLQLERIFEDRLRHFFPENKFSITVEMKRDEVVDVGFFGDVKLPTDSDATTQVAGIIIHTDSTITPGLVSEILGMPDVQISIAKVTLPEIVAPIKSKIEMGMNQQGSNLNWWLGAIGCVVVAFFIGIFFVNRSIRSLPAPIASALSQNSSGGALQSQNVQAAQSMARNMDMAFRPRAEQLKAYLSDCYWCHEDGKAAAFLREYQEIHTYSELSFGKEYINYLTSVEPEATSFWDDSYYLSPSLDLSGVSIEDMANADFLKCSKMRLSKCSLSAYELAKLKMNSENTSSVPKFGQSSHRKLVSPLVFSFSSVEEEEEFLASDLPEHVKLSAPSLYLLTKLEDVTFQTVTHSFNVKELADAWVGPQSILDKVISRLPERKQQLLLEVLETRKDRREDDKISKRESAVFKKLIKVAQVNGHHLMNERKDKIKLVG